LAAKKLIESKSATHMNMNVYMKARMNTEATTLDITPLYSSAQDIELI